MRDTFSSYHPSINFLFFGIVTVVTMFVLHPIMLAISFFAAMAYSIYLNGKKAVKFQLFGLLPLMLVAVVLNAAFNHRGITVLFYLGDNPITLESVYYGLAAATMIASVILWFSCYNTVMTSDKFIHLFGRIIPALSLILSMALRFVPRYQTQLKRIAAAQQGIQMGTKQGSFLQRAKNGIMLLSILTTWALENAVTSADSMKARGYGLKGRTSYSIYRFDARDKLTLLGMAILLAGLLALLFSGALQVEYFPSFRVQLTGWASYTSCILFALICFAPLILNIREDLLWRYLQSKI